MRHEGGVRAASGSGCPARAVARWRGSRMDIQRLSSERRRNLIVAVHGNPPFFFHAVGARFHQILPKSACAMTPFRPCFLRLLRLLGENMRKSLSINHLQLISRFPNPTQSCLIVPNRVIFINERRNHPTSAKPTEGAQSEIRHPKSAIPPSSPNPQVRYALTPPPSSRNFPMPISAAPPSQASTAGTRRLQAGARKLV